MSGMAADTGRAVPDDLEHIRRSIARILTTPLGSRVKRREFGSLIPDLIDHPTNQANLLRLQNASLMAILRWEPRVTAPAGKIVVAFDGSATVDLDLVRRGGPRAGQPINLNVPIR